MLNVKKMLVTLSAVLMVAPSLFSCASQNDPNVVYLKVLNSEDYISNGDDDTVDLIAKFEEETIVNGKKVKIIYDTFDTMENMYNTLKTGKTKYDLVCASEYMIQKLKNLDDNGDGESDLIEKIDLNRTPNYREGCSPFITEKLKTLKLEDEDYTYALCYMWGTLGILYNPAFFSPRIAEEDVHIDMKSYHSLWDSKYKRSISIKDSMRDTYAIGLIENYRDFFLEETDPIKRQKAFEYGGADDKDAEKHIKEIQNKLLELRNNIFGFEVDSGKEDIIKGIMGIDTAWSGDAVYSIDSAEEAGLTLFYSIPDEGSNVWMDCWALQKHDMNNEKERESQEAAYQFLNFLSDSDNAISNMEAIGYTSPLATREIYKGYFESMYYMEDSHETYNLEYFFGKGYDEIKVDPDKIGRQLDAQYPDNTNGTIDKLMVMQDYGKNNDLILKMWEQVKHEALPTWAIALFVAEIAIIATAITVVITLRIRNKKRRKERKNKTA